MKFTCEKDVILKEISIAQEIISSKNMLSILSNVLLEADNNTLTIRATDLKVGFETKIPVEVTVPGSTTIFCDKFLGILRSLPSGDIEFEEQENETFIIRPLFKKIDFRLKSISSEKYPEIQLDSNSGYFEISQKEIIDMISQTVFAVSDDETRYFMNGVYLDQNDSNIIMVATDGRRLSLIQNDSADTLPEFPGVIVPPKVLNLVRKLASGEGLIQISITDKNIFINFDNQKISSSLIEGQFPNYQRVIPDSQDQKLTVDKYELIEAIKRVSLLVEQKSRRVYVQLMPGTMILKSEESEMGVAKEEVAIDYDGPEMTIAVNYLYLMDPLRVIASEKVEIEFSEPNKALSVVSNPKENYFHIIMPMQLD